MAGEVPILMTTENARLLERLLRRQFSGAGGIEVRETESVVSISLRPSAARANGWPLPFAAQITGRTIDSPNRWRYDFAEITKAAPAYGGWAPLDGGRTGTAHNLAEDGNAETGVLGNGGHTDNLVGTFALQPVPVGRKVMMLPVQLADGSLEYWFDGVTIDDGVCNE